ncbi:MAG TPA: zf-HC2 domain-containing protein [Pyrinomonadaceae bacterium]|nr:zf-HC2 domain-containing protein [Pyrinomonadaceae bacterium]
MKRELNNFDSCPSPDISAYIDGELSADRELQLDLHMADCRVCSDDLNLQKSFLNALESSLDDKEIELPADFTRTVVTHAESHVTGLRQPSERRRAAVVFVTLMLLAGVALGGKLGTAMNALTSVAEKVVAVVTSIGHFCYDIALGSVIVFRSLAAGLIFDSGITAAIFLLIFVMSLLLSSRLLVRFHRT